MDKIYDKFLDIYFLKLSYSEKEYFLSNFKDDILKEEISKLTDLFNSYPFRHSAIIKNTHGFNEKKKITNWQRGYYLSIYSAYKEFILDKQSNNNMSNNYNLLNIYETLLYKNSSFTFLVNLMKEIDDDVEKEDSTSSLLNDVISYNIIRDNPEELEGIKNLSSKSIGQDLPQMTQEEIAKRVAAQLDKIKNIKG